MALGLFRGVHYLRLCLWRNVLPAQFGSIQRLLVGPFGNWQSALAPVSVIGSVMLFSMTERFVDAHRHRRSNPGYSRYKEAFWLHELYQMATKAATREAEQAMVRKKRSYWEFLDGYAFERATAEVLNKHQFNAVVTPGSGDGGIDIEVTRNGLKGVVQCKAHMASVGPHVVRDLYGVIHHSERVSASSCPGAASPEAQSTSPAISRYFSSTFPA